MFHISKAFLVTVKKNAKMAKKKLFFFVCPMYCFNGSTQRAPMSFTGFITFLTEFK